MGATEQSTYVLMGKTLTWNQVSETIDRDLREIEHQKWARPYKCLQLVEGQRILDIGCWTGALSYLMAQTHDEVVGIDVLPEAVAVARRKFPLPNLTFEVMDGQALKFQDDSFDCVVALEVIEHVQNPWGFLGGIRRVLRPGGCLVISSPNAINVYSILKQLYPGLPDLLHRIDTEPWNTGNQMDHLFAWDIFTLYRLLRRQGFEYGIHDFAGGLEIPFIATLPFNLPGLSRYARTMIFKMRKPL